MARRVLMCVALMALSACMPSPHSVETAGVHLIAGAVPEEREPDGNTLVLTGSQGLIVFDTGRHQDHAEKIIAYARQQNLPVKAIINSHWHLDHINGNIALKDVWPEAKAYTNGPSLNDAITNFLARGAEHNRRILNGESKDPNEIADARTDLAVYEAHDRLLPDVSVERTQTLEIAGRKLDLHVAQGATIGDVWLYDPQSKVLASGDLITLPAPFLDTACPAKWLKGLDDILAVKFAQVVPGHGRVMVRGDVVLYRKALLDFIVCAASKETPEVCAGNWRSEAEPLFEDKRRDGALAIDYGKYYVDLLRKPNPRSDCRT